MALESTPDKKAVSELHSRAPNLSRRRLTYIEAIGKNDPIRRFELDGTRGEYLVDVSNEVYRSLGFPDEGQQISGHRLLEEVGLGSSINKSTVYISG